MFKMTTAIDKILDMEKYYRVVQGGTSAGKTFAIMTILINDAINNPGKRIDVVSMTYDHLRDGAISDFISIMKDTNRWIDGCWNETKHIYTFTKGSFIRFKAIDKEGKARGPRRDILYINEANYISYEIFDQLKQRTNDHIYIDYNPTYKFWVHNEILESPSSELLILTYRDNEALNENILKGFEEKRQKALTNEYYKNWCDVYLDGKLGKLEGVIFNNWSEIDELPQEASLIGYGMDFGYTNDPTTCVGVYKYNNDIVLNEVIYKTGLLNSMIHNLLNQSNVSSFDYIVADSADPKSIDELRSYGYNIMAAQKGADSILFGISLMQDKNLLVTKNSSNLIKELSSYSWKRNKDGRDEMNIPQDKNNHCFSGDTLITTDKGQVRIDNIKAGDMVLTSQGYKRVLKRWNNGKKPIRKYRTKGDTFDIYISSTADHKIKTNIGWIKISQLKLGMMVYLTKNSMGKYINYTQDKNTSQEVISKCIKEYGSSIMEKEQRDSIFTISMKTNGITELKTLNLLKFQNTYQNMPLIGSEMIEIGLINSTKLELNQPNNGIQVTKELNGIVNMVKEHGRIENIKQNYVNIVGKNIKQDIQEYQNSATITAKLLHLEIGEESVQEVYDLFIEDCHEYFANGLLVHNCIDGIRYVFQTLLANSTQVDDRYLKVYGSNWEEAMSGNLRDRLNRRRL